MTANMKISSVCSKNGDISFKRRECIGSSYTHIGIEERLKKRAIVQYKTRALPFSKFLLITHKLEQTDAQQKISTKMEKISHAHARSFLLDFRRPGIVFISYDILPGLVIL